MAIITPNHRFGNVKVRFAVFALAISVAFCYGQTPPSNFPPSVGEPPPATPTGCPTATIIEMHNLTGTDTYRSMRREVAALTLGHAATKQLQMALAHDPKATHVSQMVSTMTGLTDAQDTYLCASFLLGQDRPKAGDDRGTAVWMMISVFNRMALGTWQLQEQLKKAAEDDEASRATSEVKSAEDLSAFIQDRKEAGSDLVDATSMFALKAFYTGDPTAKVADTLLVTCSERQTLLAQIAPLTKATDVDEFTKNAGLLDTLLKTHKCR